MTTMHPFIIIINGPPGVGKTTLGKKIADELQLPFISKDNIKDLLFESLGWKDREWSKKLGGASFELMYHFVETLISAQKSLIVETAFNTKFATSQFVSLKKSVHYHPIQIICEADLKTCYKRFHKRAISGNRHPGHVDQSTTWETYKDAFPTHQYGPLGIGGEIIPVNLSDLDRIDVQAVLDKIRTIFQAASP